MGQTVNLLSYDFGGSNPSFPTKHQQMLCGSSSVGRATAFQAVGRGFEPRLPLRLKQAGALICFKNGILRNSGFRKVPKADVAQG
ncbi:MAG: hypothetical protein RLZZ161_677 [Bacteroidota bacterium]